MIDQLIRLDPSGAVPRLGIDRPETANSIDLATLDALSPPFSPVPSARELEHAWLPGANAIADAIERFVRL